MLRVILWKSFNMLLFYFKSKFSIIIIGFFKRNFIFLFNKNSCIPTDKKKYIFAFLSFMLVHSNNKNELIEKSKERVLEILHLFFSDIDLVTFLNENFFLNISFNNSKLDYYFSQYFDNNTLFLDKLPQIIKNNYENEKILLILVYLRKIFLK